MSQGEQIKLAREYFKSLVTEHPEDIASLMENDFNLIVCAMNKAELKAALVMLAQEQEKKQNEEGKKKIYNTYNVNGVLWMTENLAYDDGERGIIKVNGNYYYQQYAAHRVAKKLGWIIPSPETWNALCEAQGGELLNTEVNDPLQYRYIVHHLFNRFNIKESIGMVASNEELKFTRNNFFWTNRKEGNSVVVRKTYYPKREIDASVINQYNYLPVRLIK